MKRVCTLAVTILCLVAPRTARAGGFEYQGAGTRAAGRGGAFAARGDDPMTLQYNPALLADLDGFQLMLNTNVAFYDACYQRSGPVLALPTMLGDYGTSASGMPNAGRFGSDTDTSWQMENFPRVCNGGPPGPGASLVFAGQITPELGFGVGLLTPYASGDTRFGNADGTATLPNGRALPSPARYQMVSQNLLQFFPTIGLGWAPTEWLRLGVAFQWGMTLITYTNTTAINPNEQFNGDIRTVLEGRDLFMPGVIASVHAIPHENLDVMLGFRWVDGMQAGASLALTPNIYASTPGQQQTVNGVTLQVGQPMNFTLGVRYADRTRERRFDTAAEDRLTHRVQDSMENERFDIEVDAVYQINSTVSDFLVTLPQGSTIQYEDGGALQTLPLPTPISLPHRWRDQFILRAGGDYNVIPGQFAVRGGVSYESNGVNPQYAQVDFVPAQRVGLHLGATLRVERFDISIAYMHIFQESVTAAPPLRSAPNTPVEGGAAFQQVAGLGPDGLGHIINAGTYTGDWNVVSLGVNYHFE